MRETERSLRAYFLLAGMIAIVISYRDWSAIQAVSDLLPFDWKIAIYVPIVTRVIIGVGFLIAGANLPQALLTGADWIKKLLVFSGIMILVNGALASAILDLDAAQAGIIGAIIGLLITIYLHRSVSRLSAEAAQRAGIAAPPPEAKVI